MQRAQQTSAHNRVFVTGMFRSGTTFSTRALSAHPKLLVVSDPYVYFFKGYRNFLYQRHGVSPWNPDEPMSDHFLDPHHEALQTVLRSDFSEDIPLHIANRIRRDIVRWMTRQHPELCRQIDKVSGSSFADFYESLIQLLQQVYGDADVEQLGTKACWSEEFIPALSRAFPEMRFIILVRDLRAIVASQNQKKGEGAGKRPLLFYIRQWRKSVAFTSTLAASKNLGSKILVVRYEDLVEDTRRTTERVCEHLQLPHSEQMIDASRYTHEAGGPAWVPNSSYASGQGIYRSSLERWRQVLSERELAMIDCLAGPELRLMGYRSQSSDNVIDFLDSPPEPRFDELAPWVRDCSVGRMLENHSRLASELGKELVRESLLHGRTTPDAASVERIFLNAEHFARLRQQLAGETVRPKRLPQLSHPLRAAPSLGG